MYIDNYGLFTSLRNQEGKLLTNGEELFRGEMFVPKNVDTEKWKEVSELVLLTPEAQQQRLDDLQAKINASNTIINDLERRWHDKAALKARLDDLGKVTPSEEPDGSYLSPIPYTDGMEVTEGLWYLFQDPEDPMNPNKWECKKSGIPSSADDDEYFVIIK